jgi:cellulose synthase/poly-beta-1,6-N-acetylglucosamine synthase-like glycosyltransferase
MPGQLLARIQVMEYLRAFLLGRTGWSRLQSLVLISGAFGLFRRDVVVSVGGLEPDCIGEDFELVMRIHRKMRQEKRDYRVSFVAEPVSWTEVPVTRKVLGNQRRRWHRGLWEVLWRYRGMVLNPRYGRIGLLALPYYWLFELLAPVLELMGLVLVPLGLLTGAVDVRYAVELLAGRTRSPSWCRWPPCAWRSSRSTGTPAGRTWWSPSAPACWRTWATGS